MALEDFLGSWTTTFSDGIDDVEKNNVLEILSNGGKLVLIWKGGGPTGWTGSYDSNTNTIAVSSDGNSTGTISLSDAGIYGSINVAGASGVWCGAKINGSLDDFTGGATPRTWSITKAAGKPSNPSLKDYTLAILPQEPQRNVILQWTKDGAESRFWRGVYDSSTNTISVTDTGVDKQTARVSLTRDPTGSGGFAIYGVVTAGDPEEAGVWGGQ